MEPSLDKIIANAEARANASPDHQQQNNIHSQDNGKPVLSPTEVPLSVPKTADKPSIAKTAKKVKRPHQITSRLSDEEMESFDILLLASGLSQTEYIRSMVLNGHVNVTQTSIVDAQALDTLVALSANIGQIAGIIRQTVIVNQQFSVLTPEDKDQLQNQLRSLRHLQTYVQHVAEELYGHL